ncbi:MAG: PIN domain-containing protein [Pseudomonadota bacterium]
MADPVASEPPRVLLDANLLVATLMRQILLGAARAGALQPLWSSRILEEWARAAGRHGSLAEEMARREIAALTEDWPAALVVPDPAVAATLVLPDANDVHVVAAAVGGGAEILLTRNIRDFPTRILARHGLLRRDPDGFLRDWWAEAPEAAEAVVADVVRAFRAATGTAPAARTLLKRAGLARLGKALGPRIDALM